jgi:transposase InsO family protein
VHIEVAHTLESDSFICAYQRFVARRGAPKEIFSDNGTNFKGAERELGKALQRWDQNKISDRLRRDEVQWHFNPPEASHQGGVWERMIRSVRKILKALLLEQIVSDETLLTLLAEVERILNDRPLTPVSDSTQDMEALTPNMILLLKNNASVPLLLH